MHLRAKAHRTIPCGTGEPDDQSWSNSHLRRVVNFRYFSNFVPMLESEKSPLSNKKSKPESAHALWS
jgi:hypothetical protein